MIHYIESKQLESEILASQKLVLVEFYMQDSKPCEIQSNILREIEQEYRDEIEVFKININDSKDIQIRYQFSAVPTLLFFKDCQEIERKIGLIEKNVLLTLINDLK